MLRRSMLDISRRRFSIASVPRQILTTQIPLSLLSHREFSSLSPQNGPQISGSTTRPSESGRKISKVLIGSVIVSTVVMAAYSTGYLDHIFVKDSNRPGESAKIDTDDKALQQLPNGSEDLHISKNIREQTSLSSSEDKQSLSSNVEHAEKSSEIEPHHTPTEDSSRNEGDTQTNASNVTPMENDIYVKETELPKLSQGTVTAGYQFVDSNQLPDENADKENLAEKGTMKQLDRTESAPVFTEENAVPLKHETAMPEHLSSEGESEDLLGHVEEPPSSLLDAYSLREKAQEGTTASLSGQKISESATIGEVGNLSDPHSSRDGKLIIDFLQAIHAAEQRQAVLDARVFAEEKRMMKEKYEKELKDARARELMFAEEVAMLDKEIERERVKAAAALKSLKEKAEERLKIELEQKEKAALSKLKEVQAFAKAELAAALAQEKAAHIEKMEEVNLNISALCVAFYSLSEEAHQYHSIRKLALGALTLEDALSNGLPIQTELDALHPYLDGIDKDSLLDLALSSLPEEARIRGTDTVLQLNQKFDALKGTLRHFSFLPPGGGGLLAHSLAHVASFLKVKKAGPSVDGIESVLNRVESLLAEGKLAEAADALETGVRGSAAAEVVSDWVQQARNKAITEQALTLIRSYASVSLGLS
ncbi:hypothetical protein Nepgr_008569 [Nepenthes gracilis]|uniref:MICOS complex subunit MIC60 n=1 Tax=Nepenthes gracilis TaxID=150966 RepID=A0AAD3S9I5_NEPGR|nr:hypothetical protein Nepgr_008569 [Nepenthes gracilis]